MLRETKVTLGDIKNSLDELKYEETGTGYGLLAIAVAIDTLARTINNTLDQGEETDE